MPGQFCPSPEKWKAGEPFRYPGFQKNCIFWPVCRSGEDRANVLFILQPICTNTPYT